jgi:hypothetical protein
MASVNDQHWKLLISEGGSQRQISGPVWTVGASSVTSSRTVWLGPVDRRILFRGFSGILAFTFS